MSIPSREPNTGARRAVLLLGGSGTRVRALTGGGNKHLLRVQGRTLAELTAAFLCSHGVSEIVVVASPGDLPVFRALLSREIRAELRFCAQEHPGGTAQAVLCARLDPAEGDFVVLFGDTLYERRQPALFAPLPDGAGARVALTDTDDPASFTPVELAPDGRILSMEDKPAIPRSSTVCTGLMHFRGETLERFARVQRDAKGETNLMQVVLSLWREGRLEWTRVQGWWADAGTSPEDFARVEARMLREPPRWLADRAPARA